MKRLYFFLALVAAFGLAVAPAIAGGLFGWVPAPSDSVASPGVNWAQIIQALLTAIIAAVVPILTTKAVALIGAAVEWFAAKKDESWYMRAGWIVADAVFATSQTLGDEIKEAAKDGKFTEEEKARLFNHARDLAMKNLGVIPGRLLPTIESWLKARIEAELAKLKILKQIGPASLPQVGGQTAALSKAG